MKTEKSYGVVIGRFHVPDLTAGHRYLIDTVKAKHDKLIIVVGVSITQPTERNPLGFEPRHDMIYSAYPDAIILAAKDKPGNNELWTAALDNLLEKAAGTHPVTLYGSRDSFAPCYSGKYEVVIIEPIEGNATDIRRYTAGICLNTPDFRSGIIYSVHNRIPSPYLAVDVAMIATQGYGNVACNSEIVFGKKPGEDLPRFIGGFVDSADESIAAAAKRELMEEVGRIEVADFKLIGEARIDDLRYRKDKEKIFTNLFVCKYIYGRIAPHDDIESLLMIPIKDLPRTKFNPAHEPLKQLLINHLNIPLIL